MVIIIQQIPEVALHVTRGIRWDSDHVVVLDGEVKEIAQEIVRLVHFQENWVFQTKGICADAVFLIVRPAMACFIKEKRLSSWEVETRR